MQSGIVFTNGPIFQLFAPQGRHFEPDEVKFGMANRTLHKPKQVSVDWSSNLNGLNFFSIKIFNRD